MREEDSKTTRGVNSRTLSVTDGIPDRSILVEVTLAGDDNCDLADGTPNDDGSKLCIGNQKVVNNDGLHGSRERWSAIALAPELHRIRVLCFDRIGSHSLQVSYEGPGIEKQPIPHYVMYRSGSTPGG